MCTQNLLVNNVLKQQQQQPIGLNILLVKPGSTLISRLFSYVSAVSSFKKYDYPMVTETVSLE